VDAMGDAEPFRRPWLTPERSVLLIIAIIAALALSWLGWQAHIVQHRLKMRWQIHANGGAMFLLNLVEIGPHTEGGSAQRDALGPDAIVRIYHRPEPDSGLSRLRLLLGDEEINHILFWRPLVAGDLEAIEAFPEAHIQGLAESPGAP
jgi:hypothetical protein